MLWEKNPKRAMVLLLRYVKGLSAEEVRQFMCLASENYVNQVVSVAKGDMRKKYLHIDKIIKGED
jgi:DNA-directed RNA polymerase specialized sigma24 family protein